MGIFAADELGDGTFGRGSVRGLFFVHGGFSQSVAPFRFRRTNLASPSPQGNSPPVFWVFLRRTNLVIGASGAAVPVAYFWHTEAPRKVWCHSMSGGRTWRAPPPKAIAHPFFGHFCGRRTWGRDLRARQCPRPIFCTRRPLAKSGPIPSPADELGQPLPPRL